MSDVHAVIGDIPELTGATVVRQLSGGPVNRSWLLDAGDAQLVLRVDGPLAARLGLDRRGELAVLDAVSAAGIGPEAVWADPERGWLVTRYVPGQRWERDDLKDQANIGRLAATLQHLHALPPAGPRFDPGRIAHVYAEQLGTETAKQLADDVESRAGELYGDAGPVVICHNDLLSANIIETEPLVFIDWEYAATGDPYFDLAVIVREHGMTKPETRWLLEAWSGSCTPEQRSRLEAFGQLYDRLAGLWRLVVGRLPVEKAPTEPGS